MSASNLLSQEKMIVDRKAYEPSMEEILASIRRIIADDQVFPGSSPVQEEVAESHQNPASEPVAAPVKVAPVVVAPVVNLAARSAAVAPLAAEITVAEMPAATTSKTEADVEPIARSQFGEAARNAGKSAEPAKEVKAAAVVEQMQGPAAPAAARAPQHALAAAAQTPAEPQPEIAAPSAELEFGLRGTVQPSEPAAEGPLVSPSTDQAVAGAFNALIASRFVQTSESMTDMVRDMIRPMLKTWLDDNLPIMVERLVRAEIERVARGGR
jgi:uncharacterized protein